MEDYDATIEKIEQIFIAMGTGKKEVLTQDQYMKFYKDTQQAFSQEQWGSKKEELTDEQILKDFKTQANDEDTLSKVKSINLASTNLVKISNRIKMIMKNMFEDYKNGWELSIKKNEEGPKKIAEVREEVENKYEAERERQEAARKHDRQGGRYNDRDGDYHDRRKDNRQEARYQKKDSKKNEGGNSYGKGGQEKRNQNNRNDRNRKQEKEEIVIEEITEEEMAGKIKKNFEEYVLKKTNESEPAEEDDGEEVKESKDDKSKSEQFDLSLYKTMNRKNGKTYDDLFYGLLLRVFDEEIQKVEKYFESYLD